MAQHWAALFGAEVRLKRVQRGETQASLAERMGYSDHAMITQIEMGNVLMNFDTAIELARYLHIDLNAVLGARAPEEDGPPAAAPPPAADPVTVQVLALLDKLWPWPQAQRQALTAALKAMGAVLEGWPEPADDGAPPPQDENRGPL